jgi:ferritin-like metal-binding protein YciE
VANDAHAMETELMPILRNHARDLSAIPAARRPMEQHLTETETHAARVRTAVELQLPKLVRKTLRDEHAAGAGTR